MNETRKPTDTRTRVIEPGAETLADRIDAMRALAMSADAARADTETLDLKDPQIDRAMDRLEAASEALVLEVLSAERAGYLAELSDVLAGVHMARRAGHL